MARNVTVSLTAQVDGFIASMNRAAASTQSFAAKAAGNIAKNDVAINRLANGAGIMGAALAVGIGAAVKSSADFDQAMSNVAASGADAKNNLAALRDVALKAGADTKFSATEAAAGVEELLKAGVSAKDVMGGGLAGALDLAATGNLGVGASAEAAATAMKQFGLEGSDVVHVADLMAQVAGTAQGEVSDVAEALKNGGLTAAEFGLSIDETAQVLSVFAQKGILGAEAGTKLSSSLINMFAPMGQGKKALDELGVATADAQGNLLPIGSVLDDLRGKLSGLDESAKKNALARIFGKENITAGLALVEQGSAGLSKAAKDFEAFGSAADVARTKMDNLRGDFEQFGGSVETALIGLGEGGQGPLRGLMQTATDAVNAFNGLPSGVKQTTLVVGALAAAALLGVAAVGKLAIAAVETRAALTALGISATSARAKLAALNGGGLLAVAGFVAVQAASAAMNDQLEKNSAGIDGYKQSLAEFATSSDRLDSQLDQFGGSFGLLGQGIGDTRTALKALADTQNPVSQGFRKIGDALGMSSTAGILADEFDKIDKSLTQMKPEDAAAAFKKLSDQGRAVGLTTEQINGTFDDYLRSLQAVPPAAGAAAAGGKTAAAGSAEAGAAAKKAAEDIKAATDAMYDQANAALAMSGNAIGVEQAMDDAAAAAKANGETLDINTAKGRANQAALDSLASATLTATQAMVEQGRSAGDIVATNERARASYIKTARAMGASRSEAESMADALFKIPKQIRSQVVVAGSKVSKKEAQDLNKALKDIPKEKRARIVTLAETKGAKEAQREIAKVKNKSVIAKATGKGVDTVREIDGAIKKLKSKEVRANAKAAGKADVNALDKAIDGLKSKRVAVSASTSGTGGIQSLRSEINKVQGKTVTVRVKKEDFADGGFVHGFAGGGRVRGSGGPREDNIAGIDRMTGVQTAWVSANEFVVNAAQTAANYAQLAAINAGGKWDLVPRLASGGISGAPTGFGVDQSLILRLVAALATPLTAVTAAARALGTARTVSARENRESPVAKAAYLRAVAADKKADAAVRTGGKATKGEKARAARTEAAKDKAEAAYKTQLDQQKDATAKLSDATRSLADANAAAADSARSMSDQFAAAFRSGSTDPKDWIAEALGGSAEITKFTAQLAQLRKAGLVESQIQRLIGQGTTAGSETAANILAGGNGLIKQLNTANQSLEKAADALGYLGALAPQRKAAGGYISGPGSATSDSIAARLSNGEYVINAAATAVHRPLLDSINYGRSVVAPARFAQTHYASGGYVNTGPALVDTGAIAAAVEDGLSRASFVGYIDGQPFQVMVDAKLRARGRSGTRTR